jgi:hypothetical protein
MLDYLTNITYGCGVPISNVNTQSIAEITTLSQAPLSIVDVNGNTVTNSFTYQLNGVVDTTVDCLDTLQSMADSCDSWIQWNEKLGQWGIIPNISLAQQYQLDNPGTSFADAVTLSTASMFVVTSDHIIGGINLTPTDLKASANQITINYPDATILNQIDNLYYWLPDQYKNPNEPVNNIDVNLPFVTDPTQATYLGYRKLWMSREDLIINFTMDYSGIALNAGDIIAVNHEWYGWLPANYNGLYTPGKPFRVTQVQESKDESGFLGTRITASSYNDSIYYTTNPITYNPGMFGLQTDPNQVPTPIQPELDVVNDQIVMVVNTSSLITTMQLWLSTTTNISDSQLFQTFNAPNQSLFANGTTLFTPLKNVPSYTGYAYSRALNKNNNASDYSVGTQFTWTNAILDGTYIYNTATNSAYAGTATNLYILPTILRPTTKYAINLTPTASTIVSTQVSSTSSFTFDSITDTLETPNLTVDDIVNINPLSSPPATFVTGTIAMADAVNWDPVSLSTTTAYLALYNGVQWVKLG